MILQSYQNQHNISDAKMCRLLNHSKEPAEPPVFEHRLCRLKGRLAQAKGHEIKALMRATNDECDRYS
ncbi:hypothetical protein SLPG_00054 [Salicola phage CGphi29]|uniref:hypothetical protein n=1 Tax=Salicola phage CGphi29 TaxID=754067 RepID=UPI0002C095B9|nr:hypothetical protein SLPG_00054 [Salicola phage CGphi29]AGH31848.1 hypothetical protein SLPG_00054 [Salicola phage CGphi29]